MQAPSFELNAAFCKEAFADHPSEWNARKTVSCIICDGAAADIYAYKFSFKKKPDIKL